MSRTTKLASVINIIARLSEARNYKPGMQHQYMSQFAAIEVQDYEEEESREMSMKKNWIPHPDSGIYYPEGHDEVMKDVSENNNAASFWLRNNIHYGAERHDPDLISADHYFLTSTLDYDDDA